VDYTTPEGYTYFYNKTTKETVWEKPAPIPASGISCLAEERWLLPANVTLQTIAGKLDNHARLLAKRRLNLDKVSIVDIIGSKYD